MKGTTKLTPYPLLKVEREIIVIPSDIKLTVTLGHGNHLHELLGPSTYCTYLRSADNLMG
jgi:hypothetical protein